MAAKEDADNQFNQLDLRYKEKKIMLLKELQVPEVNKQLCMQFMEACQVGMYGQKIGMKRLIKSVETLYSLCLLLPLGKTWHDLTKADTVSMLLKIQERPSWGPWSQYVLKSVLRKFIAWLRNEYGYPAGYPNGEKLAATLPLIKYPLEVRFSLNKPNHLKAVEEIPTKEEIQWLMSACDSQIYGPEGLRDKAILAILEETGLRIGGLGTLCIKNVTFDPVGALLTVHDKTMKGDPVRIITSIPYLKAWLEKHPDGANLDAPLWANLGPSHKHKGMIYQGMDRMLKKAVRIHNELAEVRGLPKITRRIHFHAIRYYRQTKDMVAGMPVSIQCKRRGWSPTSRQPMMYARVTTDQVDKWLIEHSDIKNNASTGTIKRD